MTTKKERRMQMMGQRRRMRSWKRWAYVFIVSAAVVGGGWLLAPAFWSEGSHPERAAIVEIKGTMGGFSTSVIRAKAGRPLTVRLTSVDSRFHTDGGGKHQFAIDYLKVNIIAPPLGTREATFTPAEPGIYDYYCDVCCGGRANPTMVGKLIVEA